MSSSSNTKPPPIRRWDDSDSSSEDEKAVLKKSSLSAVAVIAETRTRSAAPLDTFSSQNEAHPPCQNGGGSTSKDPQRRHGGGAAVTAASSWKDMARQSQKFKAVGDQVDGSAWMAQRQSLQQQREMEAQKKRLEEEQQQAHTLKIKQKHQFDALKAILQVNQHERVVRESVTITAAGDDVTAVSHGQEGDKGKDIPTTTTTTTAAATTSGDPPTSLQARLNQMTLANTGNTTHYTSSKSTPFSSDSITKASSSSTTTSSNGPTIMKVDKILTKPKQVDVASTVVASTLLGGHDSTIIHPTQTQTRSSSSLQQSSLLDMQTVDYPTQGHHDDDSHAEIRSSKNTRKYSNKKKGDPSLYDKETTSRKQNGVEDEKAYNPGGDTSHTVMNKEPDHRNRTRQRTGAMGRGGTYYGRGASHPSSSHVVVVGGGEPSQSSTDDSNPKTTSHVATQSKEEGVPERSSSLETYSINLDDYSTVQPMDDTALKEEEEEKRYSRLKKHGQKTTQGELQPDGTVRLTQRLDTKDSTTEKKGRYYYGKFKVRGQG